MIYYDECPFTEASEVPDWEMICVTPVKEIRYTRFLGEWLLEGFEGGMNLWVVKRLSDFGMSHFKVVRKCLTFPV